MPRRAKRSAASFARSGPLARERDLRAPRAQDDEVHLPPVAVAQVARARPESPSGVRHAVAGVQQLARHGGSRSGGAGSTALGVQSGQVERLRLRGAARTRGEIYRAAGGRRSAEVTPSTVACDDGSANAADVLSGARPSIGKRRADPQPRHPGEVLQIPGHELQVVPESRRGDLQVGIGQRPACTFQPRSDHRRRHAPPAHRRRARSRPAGPASRCSPGGARRRTNETPPCTAAHHHGARELLLAGQLRATARSWMRVRLQELGDRVRVEQVGHRPSAPSLGTASRLRPSRPATSWHQLLRAPPPTREAGQPGRRSGGTEPLELQQPVSAHQRETALPWRVITTGSPASASPDALSELRPWPSPPTPWSPSPDLR